MDNRNDGTILLGSIIMDVIKQENSNYVDEEDGRIKDSCKSYADNDYKAIYKYLSQLKSITNILTEKFKIDNRIYIPEKNQEQIKIIVRLLYKNLAFKKSVSIVSRKKGLLSSELKGYIERILEELEQNMNEEHYSKMSVYNKDNINRVECGKHNQYLRDIIEETIFGILNEKHDKLYCVYMQCYTNSVKRIVEKWNVIVSIATYLHNLSKYNKSEFEKIKFEYALTNQIEDTDLMNSIELTELKDVWVKSDYEYIKDEFSHLYHMPELTQEADIVDIVDYVTNATIGLGTLHKVLQDILIELLQKNMMAYEKYIGEILAIKNFDEAALEEYMKIIIQE